MALQGTLDTFALADLVRLLATTEKTGELVIDGDRGTGRLWFVDGALVAGEPVGDDLIHALFVLLRMTEGDFTFAADARTDTATEPRSALDALAEAELRLEQWLPVEALVPTPAVTLGLREVLAHDECTVTRAVWSQLVLIGGGTTAARFGTALDLDEMAAAFAVRDLVEAGLVDVGDPAVDDTPAPADDVVHPLDAPLADLDATPTEADDAVLPDLDGADRAIDGADQALDAPLAEVVPLARPAASDSEDRWQLGEWQDTEVLARALLPSSTDDHHEDDPAEAEAERPHLLPDAPVDDLSDLSTSSLGPWEPLAAAEAAPTSRPEGLPTLDRDPTDQGSVEVDLDRHLGAAVDGHSYLGTVADDGVGPEPLPEAALAVGPPPPPLAGPEPLPESFPEAVSAEAGPVIAPWGSPTPPAERDLHLDSLSPAAARAVAAAATDRAEDTDAGRRVLRRIISTGKG